MHVAVQRKAHMDAGCTMLACYLTFMVTAAQSNDRSTSIGTASGQTGTEPDTASSVLPFLKPYKRHIWAGLRASGGS